MALHGEHQDDMSTTAQASGKTGVLLVNTGSPDAPEPRAVKEYLSAYLMDPCIRPMATLPWWLILHCFILPSRKYKSAEKYRQIWMPEGSPLAVYAARLARKVTDELARRGAAAQRPMGAPGASSEDASDASQDALQAKGPLHAEDRVIALPAMSYGKPPIAAALKNLCNQGCERVLVIPLYPQTAHSTNGSIELNVRRVLDELGGAVPQVRFIKGYGEEPSYVSAVAGSLRKAGLDASRDHVFFSFHAVPQPDVDAGDTYPAQVERSCELIAGELGLDPTGYTVSYHSPFEDNRRWHGPFTASVLPQVAPRVAGRCFFVCPGFSIDCLETLYDVRAIFEPLYRSCAPAGEGLVYVPCLNDDDAQVALMADLIERERAC